MEGTPAHLPFTFVRLGGMPASHQGMQARLWSIRHVELQRTNLLERQSESALRMADTVNSYTHYNVTGLAFALTFAPPVAVIHCSA